MFAIIRTGGRQYRVQANQVLKVDRLAAGEGDQIVFDDVLMLSGDQGAEALIGRPRVEGACVAARVVSQARNARVLAFKKRRRKHSQKIHGHRQHVSVVAIDGIFTDGVKPVFKEMVKKQVEVTQAETSSDKGEGEGRKSDEALVPALSASLTDLKGVGQVLGDKLATAGLTLEVIAGLNEDDIARYDAELDLKGKITKNDWVAQAKELIG